MQLINLNSRRKALLWLFQFGVLLLLLLLIQTGNLPQLGKPLKLNADLTAIFAETQKNDISDIADQLSEQASNHQLVLVSDKDLSIAIEKADSLAKKLSKHSLIKSVQVTFADLPKLDEFVKQYLPYKQQLLSNEMKEKLTSGNASDIFAEQFSLLSQPSNQFVARTIEHDASLMLASFLSQPLAGASGLNLQQNHLVTHYQDKFYVLVTFQSSAASIDIDSAQNLVKAFKQLIAGDEDVYLYTGAMFYASKASSVGQHEMMLYGSISLIATLLFIALVYRNVVAIISTMTLITISFVYGYLALTFAYNEISIITLVFSVTLIGISADYSFHALTEMSYPSDKMSNAMLQKLQQQPLADIFASLTMSYVTTGAGYALLFLAPFVLFKQIAIFTLFGLLGALITVLLVFPLLRPLLLNGQVKSRKQKLDRQSDEKCNKSAEVSIKVVPAFAQTINACQQKLVLTVARYKVPALFLLVISLILASQLRLDNDIRHYYSPDKQLQHNENQVKAIVQQKWDLQYFLIKANTAELALQKTEQVVEQLALLQQQKAISDFSAISQWLPSIKMQRVNKELFDKSAEQGSFNQLLQMLNQPLPMQLDDFSALTADNWLSSAMGKLYQTQWLVVEQGEVLNYYSVVKLAGVSNIEPLQNLAESLQQSESIIPGSQVHFVDKAGSISQQLSLFSQQLHIVLIAAILAALLVFVWRYGLKRAMLGVVTPVFSLVIALIVSYFMQGSLNIFNLVAGILILALGLDYSVFYAEHGLSKKVTLTTLLSAMSSVFVFAMLIFSSMPAIHSFGLTVFIGVLLTFVLAPTVTLAKLPEQK